MKGGESKEGQRVSEAVESLVPVHSQGLITSLLSSLNPDNNFPSLT